MTLPETQEELLTKIECDAISNQILRTYTDLANASENQVAELKKRIETYAVSHIYIQISADSCFS